MSLNRQHGRPRRIWLLPALLATSLAGCTSLKLPSANLPFSSGDKKGDYVPVGAGVELHGTASEAIYHMVRQARSQNAIVLEVVGDSTPARILPLPPGEKSAFVSELLTQTGVQEKLGPLDATLFRDSPHVLGGLKMEVKMSSDKRSVRPESDYALRPGDRLQVVKAPNPGLQNLLNMALGL